VAEGEGAAEGLAGGDALGAVEGFGALLGAGAAVRDGAGEDPATRLPLAAAGVTLAPGLLGVGRVTDCCAPGVVTAAGGAFDPEKVWARLVPTRAVMPNNTPSTRAPARMNPAWGRHPRSAARGRGMGAVGGLMSDTPAHVPPCQQTMPGTPGR